MLNHLLELMCVVFFLFSKSDLFMSSNDLEHKKTEPNKKQDKII